MMMQIDLSAALAVIAAVVSLAGTAISFGIMKQKLDQLYVDRERWREEMEKKSETHSVQDAALQMRIEALATKMSDNYMLKPDIIAIENRVSDKQREIVSKVDKLDGKIDQVMQLLLEGKRP